MINVGQGLWVAAKVPKADVSKPWHNNPKLSPQPDTTRNEGNFGRLTFYKKSSAWS